MKTSDENSRNEMNNAFKMHLILVNIGAQAVRFSLENELNPDPNVNNIPGFLQQKYDSIDFHIRTRGQNIQLNSAKDVYYKLDDYLSNKGAIFPANLDLFDLSGLYSIVRNLLDDKYRPLNGRWGLTIQDYHLNDVSLGACVDNLHLLRNHFLGHLNFYRISLAEYQEALFRIKQIVEQLCPELRPNIDEIDASLIVTSEMMQAYHECLMDMFRSKLDDFKPIKEIQNCIKKIILKRSRCDKSDSENLKSVIESIKLQTNKMKRVRAEMTAEMIAVVMSASDISILFENHLGQIKQLLIETGQIELTASSHFHPNELNENAGRVVKKYHDLMAEKLEKRAKLRAKGSKSFGGLFLRMVFVLIILVGVKYLEKSDSSSDEESFR